MSTHHESDQLSPNAIFARLRDVCAKLYPLEQDTRVIADDVDLKTSRIAFSARAETNWHNILAEAIGHNQLDALLDRIRSGQRDSATQRLTERNGPFKRYGVAN